MMYTLLWLYEIFWWRRWIWFNWDGEWRLTERTVNERRGWVSESGEGEWERLGFSVRVRGWAWVELCIRERVSESGEWFVWEALNLKNTSSNRVLETRFLIFPCGPTTSDPNGHVTKLKSLRLEFQVYSTWNFATSN